jgi:hypothetical protein
MKERSGARLGIVAVPLLVLACIPGLLLVAGRVQALPAYDRLFKQKYQYSTNCAACHISGGGSQNTGYGRDFLGAGATLEAFDRIAKMDSDGDGFSNIDEIQARSNPGDSKSTPKTPGDWLAGTDQPAPEAQKSPEPDTSAFDLNQKETPADKKGLNVGPITNINFGGLLDLRYGASDSDAPNLVIHVNELVVTANVTDNISLLLEYLLPTTKNVSLVEDDHGFSNAIITNIPLLPVGTALKIGRYRFKYGVDARLDAAANPLYPLVRKNLGFISDLGIELSGFFGPVTYTASVLNGPDHLEVPVVSSSGDPLGTSIVPIQNNSKPVAIRFAGTFPGGLETGVTYFEGRSWPYMNGMHMEGAHAPGGVVDKSGLVFKRRFTVDLAYRIWKLDILGEGNYGMDYPAGTNATVQGYYGRIDYSLLPRRLILAGQYDVWDDGLAVTGDEHTLSGEVTYYVTSQVFIRAAYAYERLNGSPRPNTGTLQLYLPF